MLAIITSFFNPNHCPYRLENYRHFSYQVRRVGLPLYAMELAFGEQDFQLCAGEATYLYQLRCRDLMFQKERMLNLLLEKLPAKIDKVIWMDADIVYLLDDWPDRIEKSLRQYKVVQPFTYCVALPKCNTSRIDQSSFVFYDSWGAGNIRNSFAFHLHQTNWFANIHHGHLGYVWAAQREFLERHKFYDKIITGAGDLLMTLAFSDNLGWIDHLFEFRALGDRAVCDYFNWAFPVAEELNKSIGFTEDLIMHLWHGDLTTRNYLHNSAALQLNDFAPSDLELDKNGCWQWSSNQKPELRDAIEKLFKDQQVA